MEAVHLQGRGPWRIGVGAKIHNLSWTDERAAADHEVQRVAISSVVVRETQVSWREYILQVFEYFF